MMRGADPTVLWLSRDVSESIEARQREAVNRRLLQEMLELQEKEQQLLAGQIHDGFVQYVVGANMWLQSLDGHVAGKHANSLVTIQDSLQQAMVCAREIIDTLRPTVPSSQSLDFAVQAIVHQFDQREGPRFEFQLESHVGPLLSVLEGAIIRIVNEALTNVIRHSRASRAVVRLHQGESMVTLVVEDDGCGFDSDNRQAGSVGLDAMVSRAEIFGGSAEIQSGQRGTKLCFTLPAIPPEEDASDGASALSSFMVERAQAAEK